MVLDLMPSRAGVSRARVARSPDAVVPEGTSTKRSRSRAISRKEAKNLILIFIEGITDVECTTHVQYLTSSALQSAQALDDQLAVRQGLPGKGGKASYGIVIVRPHTILLEAVPVCAYLLSDGISAALELVPNILVDVNPRESDAFLVAQLVPRDTEGCIVGAAHRRAQPGFLGWGGLPVSRQLLGKP